MSIKQLQKYFDSFRYYFLRNGGDKGAVADALRGLQIKYEKTAVIATMVGFVILALCDGFCGHLSLHFAAYEALVPLVFGAAALAFPMPRRHYHLVFSAFYIASFLFYYYLPAAHPGAFSGRNAESAYLLHVFLLLTQAVRPGRFVGIIVVLFLLAHSAREMALAGWSDSTIVRLPLFFIAGGLALFAEGVLYIAFIEYLILKRYYSRSVEDLLLAEKVHRNLFPAFRANEKFRIVPYVSPEGVNSGDFYDLIHLREGNIGFFLTDVSGHGIASAMFSAALKVILATTPYRFRLSPEALLTHLDETMNREYPSHHASAVYLFFDFQARVIRLANGGHPEILSATPGQKFHAIETEGSILGYNLRQPIARELSMPMVKGQRFLVYSDGLTEYRDNENNIVTLPPICEVMDGLEVLDGEQLVNAVVSRIRERADFARFHDDVMLVLVEVR
ncbi:MAG: serine/threonine-protein phosphatase [Spirochaetia bacterium]|nr:serine/threonine-protein phosphatase [Spirochaetia bacterium]